MEQQADSLLLIGGDTVMSWNTGSTKLKALLLTFNETAISLGTTLKEEGKLKVKVTNEEDKADSTEINITYIPPSDATAPDIELIKPEVNVF